MQGKQNDSSRLKKKPKAQPKTKRVSTAAKITNTKPCIIQNPKFTHHDQQNTNTQTSLKFYHKLKLKRK